jgi:hypothetical protein
MHSDAMHPEKLTIPNGLFKKKPRYERLITGWWLTYPSEK